MRFRSRRFAVVLLLALIGAISLVLGWPSARKETGISRRRQHLLAAFGRVRPFESRFFGMQHSPFNARHRNLQLTDARAVRAAVEELSANRCRNASCKADLALVAALSGKLDDAVALLRSATAEEPAESWIASDLAAVLFARWRSQKEPDDLLLALEAAEQAVHSTQVPLEARFNRALALQELNMRAPARSAWQGYLAREATSAWSDEARSHLATLVTTASPRATPEADRDRAEELLDLWAEAAMKGRREEAETHLAAARTIGSDLATHTREHAIAGFVAAIDRAGPIEQAELARSRGLFGRRLASFRHSGGPDLERALNALIGAHTPLAAWARLLPTSCDVQRFRFAEVAMALNLVLEEQTTLSPSHAGSAHRKLDLLRYLDADPAAVESLAAENFRLIGDWSSASRHLMSALKIIADSEKGRVRYLVTCEAAALAEDLDLQRAALLFNDEALRALSTADVAGLVIGLHRRATLSTELGLHDQSRAALDEAQRLLPRILNPETRKAIRGDLLAAESAAIMAENPRQAITILSFALGICYTDQIPVLLVQRAEAYIAAGQPALAETDLIQALGALENFRRYISVSDQQSLLEQRRGIYDEMTRVQLALGHKAAAFLWSDRSRAGGLAETLDQKFPPREDPAAGTAIARLEDGLALGTVLVEYAFVGGVLKAWVLRRGDLQLITLPMCNPEVINRVARLIEAGESGRTMAFQVESAALFDALVYPLFSRLRAARRIVFVPDGPLHQIPFAALRNGAVGRYLVEDFEILVAPGAAVHVAAARRQASFSGPPESILTFADPAINRRTWPSLSNLPEARIEAIKVGALYPKPDLRLGQEATPQSFLRDAPRFSVLHLATHAIVNSRHPELTALILGAPVSGQGNGALYARDLKALRLPSTRLVFLAVCGSLGGPIGRGAAASSLARPFLAAGVPSVVGALWRVDDEATRSLALSFHSSLRQGLAPIAALRAAQLEQLAVGEENRSVLSWAAFELLGS